MDNPIKIGRVKCSDQVETVIRTGQFMGKNYVNIREYFNAPGAYEGFTKRGIRIPLIFSRKS